jgi:GAF domain-containing protein
MHPDAHHDAHDYTNDAPRLRILPGSDDDNAAFIRDAADHVRRMLADGTPRREILTRLATAAERLAGPRAAASILVLDENGLLRNGASPNLPPDYLDAIDRLRPDPAVGTCAAAAATGSVVITVDFFADDKWAELRHLPLSIGYVGAWSVPIKSPAGKVLGTFGTYYRDRRAPTPEERTGIPHLAAAAAIALGER